tara:strand:- start:628 stop:1503 length:876 start_codon:yes stop_codon:yes gene_type:complete
MASKRKQNIEDLRTATTRKIISQLEDVQSGDWQKSWFSFNGCYNIDTGTVYKGMNQFNLSMLDYDVPMFSTFVGWKKLDCKIKKGSKGHQITKFSISKKENNLTGAEEIKMYQDVDYVFNCSQVDGNIPVHISQKNPEQTIDKIELFKEKCLIDTRHILSNRAYYAPLPDQVTMPQYEQFKGSQDYYATLFHEYAHATGHQSRLNRKFDNSFGDSDYAFEELIAELSSVFTMQHLGFYENSIREDHIQYIKGWLKVLKSDNTFIFKASSLAQKATDYLIEQSAENKKVAIS